MKENIILRPGGPAVGKAVIETIRGNILNHMSSPINPNPVRPVCENQGRRFEAPGESPQKVPDDL